MKNWATVAKSESLEHLEILKINLKENCGIDAVVLNKKVSGYQLGSGELLVSIEDAEKASEYLNK